jgi:transcriptional regulator with XRE-family HTH domain
MNRPIASRELSYEARARIADNVFLLRKRAGPSQEELSKLAMVSADRIGKIENGHVNGKFDSYVRLAGALSVPVYDLLARWLRNHFPSAIAAPRRCRSALLRASLCGAGFLKESWLDEDRRDDPIQFLPERYEVANCRVHHHHEALLI